MEETKEGEILGTQRPEEGQKQEADLLSVRKYFSRLGLMYFLGAMAINGAQFLASFFAGLLQPRWLDDPTGLLALSMLPTYLVGMPIMIALIKRIPAAGVEPHSMKAGDFLTAAVMCFGAVYLSNLLGNALTALIGLLKGGEVGNVLADMTASANLGVVFVFTVLCAPFMEEYIFRKLLVDRTVRCGEKVAVLLSGLMFGLFHGNLNQFAYAFTLGMFLAFLYAKTGKLKITIALHMLVNFMGSVALLLLTKFLDLDEYLKLAESGAGSARMVQYFLEHLFGWLLYGAYGLWLLIMLIAGIVLWIIALKKGRFVLAPGEIVIPRGKRFFVFFGNWGMGLFVLFWIGVIIWQLLA